MNEQVGFPHQANGHRAKQNLLRRDLVVDARARRQAAEAEAIASTLRGNTRIPLDPCPQVSKQPPQQEDALEEDEFDDDAELSTRAPRSAVKYQLIDPSMSSVMGAMGVTFKPGSPPPNRHAIPARRSAQYQQEPPPKRGSYEETIRHEEEVYTEAIQKPRTHRHVRPNFLVFLGIGLLLMIAGYMAFSDLGSWWQTHTDDSTYGNPRTFQMDAVVGHGDSDSNPSHFIALNLKGDIVVLEIPGGNVKKMLSYPITTLPGNQGNPPVKLVFQDFDHDGRIDLLVQIGDPPNTINYLLLNNGTQFVGKS